MRASIYFSVWAISVGLYMVIYLLGLAMTKANISLLGIPVEKVVPVSAPAQIGAAFPQIGGGFMDKVKEIYASYYPGLQFWVHALVFSLIMPGILLAISSTGGEGFEDASAQEKNALQRAVDTVTSVSSKAASRIASLF